jgi:AraC-like DNA-binding protein
MGHTVTPLVRSASLTGFSDLCIAQRLDPKRLAAAAGVPSAALSNPDLKLDSARVGRLLALAAEKSGVEAFGLKLAETRRLSNLGPVGLIARDQSCLRDALGVMRQYLWMHNEALFFSLEELDDIAVLRVELITDEAEAGRQAIELCLGVLCTNVSALLGRRWRPELTAFRHRAPVDLAAHRRMFGKAPQFLQDFNGLVFARTDLAAPVAAADAAMARQVERYIEGLAEARPATTRQAVSDLIVLLLPTTTCSADRVAAHLGIDRRTLHRRLAANNTNFSALLSEQRSRLAHSLLGAGKSCTLVAELTGFASLSTFSHWFRRRFRKAPREFQRSAA